MNRSIWYGVPALTARITWFNFTNETVHMCREGSLRFVASICRIDHNRLIWDGGFIVVTPKVLSHTLATDPLTAVILLGTYFFLNFCVSLLSRL